MRRVFLEKSKRRHRTGPAVAAARIRESCGAAIERIGYPETQL
jgi:hypothetical protein